MFYRINNITPHASGKSLSLIAFSSLSTPLSEFRGETIAIHFAGHACAHPLPHAMRTPVSSSGECVALPSRAASDTGPVALSPHRRRRRHLTLLSLGNTPKRRAYLAAFSSRHSASRAERGASESRVRSRAAQGLFEYIFYLQSIYIAVLTRWLFYVIVSILGGCCAGKCVGFRLWHCVFCVGCSRVRSLGCAIQYTLNVLPTTVG